MGVQHHHAHVASCLADNGAAGRGARHRGSPGRDRLRDRRGRLGRRVLRGERGGRIRAARTPGIRLHARWIGGHPATVADGARATRRALRRGRGREAPARTCAPGWRAERAARRPARGAQAQHPADLQRGPALRRRRGDGRSARNGADYLRGTGRGGAGTRRGRPGEPRLSLPAAARGRGWIVETREIIRGVVEDLLAGRATGEISSRFHRTMAEVVVAGCERDPGSRRKRPPSRSPAAPSRTCSFWNRWYDSWRRKGSKSTGTTACRPTTGDSHWDRQYWRIESSENNVGAGFKPDPRADQKGAKICVWGYRDGSWRS